MPLDPGVPDYKFARRADLAVLLLQLEREDRSWTGDETVRFLHSLRDTSDIRFIGEMLTALKTGGRIPHR